MTVLIPGLLLSFLQRWLREKARCSAWKGTRAGIRVRVALEIEREHQEHLLLSVLLAYLTAEVKRSLMLKMTSSPHRKPLQQFTDLFVQRHSNVSILYADIVHFT